MDSESYFAKLLILTGFFGGFFLLFATKLVAYQPPKQNSDIHQSRFFPHIDKQYREWENKFNTDRENYYSIITGLQSMIQIPDMTIDKLLEELPTSRLMVHEPVVLESYAGKSDMETRNIVREDKTNFSRSNHYSDNYNMQGIYQPENGQDFVYLASNNPKGPLSLIHI